MKPAIQAIVAAISKKKKKPESGPESGPESMPESIPESTRKLRPFKSERSSEYEMNKKDEKGENIDMKYPTYEEEEGKPYKAIDDGAMNNEMDEDESPVRRKGLFGGNGKGLSIIIQMGRKRA